MSNGDRDCISKAAAASGTLQQKSESVGACTGKCMLKLQEAENVHKHKGSIQTEQHGTIHS